MNPIEQQIYEFIEQVGLGKAVLSEDAIEEFGERCKQAVRDKVAEAQEREFRLRMSNIGRPLRQLMLEQKYGYNTPSPSFIIKMLYGSFYEALTLMLLKASKVDVTDHDKAVTLRLAGQTILGTYDVKIGDKIYDVKSASPYAYEHKFISWESLAKSDDFGYVGQGFGYAAADGSKFGGWIVINKATGEFKVIEIPDDLHDELSKENLAIIADKVKHITENGVMPECGGVIEETYYKKPTGNKVLGGSCRFCSHKEKCHPELQHLPSKASKSENAKYVYYVEVKDVED